jgi:dTDP-4-amino-4,6-dideoxygalactose transaminase
MEALAWLESRHGLRIVEDAAQALGSRFAGQCAGTFGAAAAVSFYPAKLLGCLGDGGAVIANQDAVAERVWALHDHGRDGHGNLTGWGLNSRLDNLQAAILDYRLEKHDAAIARRRELAQAYDAALAEVAEVVRPPAPDADALHFDVYQNYEIEAEERGPLREFLAERGVGTLIPWGGKAVHQWEALGLEARLPTTERLFERLLLLPMHAWLTDDDIAMVAGAVRQFYRGE